MRSFLKTFFAAFLALIIFTLLIFLFLSAIVGSFTSKDTPSVQQKSVLVLDLGLHFSEQVKKDPFGILSDDNRDIPGLYDVTRLLRIAKIDKHVSGIYVIANGNPNGLAASEEIRNALIDFKQSGKFVIAHGDMITQKAYGIANVADKIYVNPRGFVEWLGYNVSYLFLKGTLDKLDIKPQIFYAGKFKSATEPFRTDHMTEENELQTSVWMHDLYSDFLSKTSDARKIDTATLRQLANEGRIRSAKDAADNKLVDGLKYDDEIKDEIKERLKIGKYDRISFIGISSYHAATDLTKKSGEKIVLIYAEGNIVDGKSEQGMIGSETYRNLIRKARLDRNIKAIVFRINSGGGSALASENIWRELALAKKEKPVVVSFGDVAASGGYYIACAADSIFAQRTTITGSIGVFGIIPNMQDFFKNKLGITFDGVKTGPYADLGAAYRPMTGDEMKMVQDEIEAIYTQFKQRVAEGRKMSVADVDSIGQGRVWTGIRAKGIGLIDRFGGIDDAIRSAASLAKLSDYSVREFPEPVDLFDQIFGKKDPMNYTQKLEEELGAENYKIYLELKRIKEMSNSAQARLPFQFFIK